jgi:hypothetical protein
MMKKYIKPETAVTVVMTATAFLKASNVIEVSSDDYDPEEMTPLSRRFNVWDDEDSENDEKNDF